MSPLFHGHRVLELQAGKTLFDYADELAVRVPTSCGRTGECHECIVEVSRGGEALSGLTQAETFLRGGNYRLACQASIEDTDADLQFNVLRRQPRILTETIDRTIDLDPLTRRDGDQIIFHSEDGTRNVDAYPGRILGIAADIGTTTVAMNLVDLESGETRYVASFENPQRFGGSDVMHRITYDSGEHRGELQSALISSINFEIGEMVKTLKIRRRHIVELVAVGNATMRDILFGIDVESIGVKPYKSLVEGEYLEGKRNTTALNATAAELGIRIHPKANVYGGPLVASHVGADVAADLLALRMWEENEMVMLLDIGTNTEIVAGNRNGMVAASCPAGPAFEGGEVTYAMPGYDGAVESLRIGEPEADPELKVIGEETEPIGICGSGIIDLLAELRRVGIMSELGVFADGSQEFRFSRTNNLTLSRRDISALAQAKAANFCGQQIVIQHMGNDIDDYSRLYLAGGFANYIDPKNASAIGFIPYLQPEKIVKVGNSALLGATMMLLSGSSRTQLEKAVADIKHIELETSPDFFDYFVEGCQFKPMNLEPDAS